MLRRSTLIIPANMHHLLKRDHLKGADAVLLDLEDAVHPKEKETARNLIQNSIPLASQCGAEVLVRINNDPILLPLDLEASVCRGLDGIALPKTESVEDVLDLESRVASLEQKKGLKPGHIRLSILIESPRGLLNAREISISSSRIDSVTLAPEDYSQALGVEQSKDGLEMLFPLSWIVIICKSAGILPIGRLGSVEGVHDVEGFKRAATLAMQLGCEGSFCTHPDQVAVLNQIFSFPSEKVDHARKVVEAFEKEAKHELPSSKAQVPKIEAYNRARLVLSREQEIVRLERRKSMALARMK